MKWTGPNLETLRQRFGLSKREQHEVKRCPVCRSRSRHAILDTERHGFKVASYLCAGCGAVYLSPIMEPHGYMEFYGKWYHDFVSAFWGTPFGPRRYHKEQRLYGDKLAPFIVRRLPKHKRRMDVLDVGGSLGMIADRMTRAVRKARHKSKATVVDPSGTELKHAEKLGCEVIHGTVETVNLGDRKWQLALMCRTIDHLAEPRETLQKIHRHLSSKGLLFVDYVDYDITTKHRGVRRATQIDHICNFTSKTFYDLMANIGFRGIGPKWQYASERGRLFVKTTRADPCYRPDHAEALLNTLRERIQRDEAKDR